MVINFGSSCKDNTPREEWLTMTELAVRFSRPDTTRGKLTLAEYLALDKTIRNQKQLRDREKDGEYFIPAKFKKHGTRSSKDVEYITGYTGDIDTGKISREIIEAKLHGYQYVANSSYSHQTAVPRWRFFVPYKEPLSPEQHKKVHDYFQAAFGGQIDNRCGTSNQLWYTPACPHDAENIFEFFYGHGVLLDGVAIQRMPCPPTTDLHAEPHNSKKLGPITQPKTLAESELARIESALSVIPSDDRDVWIKVGLALRRQVGDEHGLKLWLAWSAKSSKFDINDATSTWESFDVTERGQAVSLGSVFHLAKENGWSGPMAETPPFVDELNGEHFVAMEDTNTWVFREDFDPEMERTYLVRMKVTAFKEFFLNQSVLVQRDDQTVKKNKAKAWLEHAARRSYKGISFKPGGSPPPGHYNLWRGFGVKPVQGDWSLMQRHIEDVICAGNKEHADYLLKWMAFAVQHPDKRAEVAVVLQGGRGTGKGKFGEAFGKLFGEHALQITQSRHLIGNFNAHFRTCVFLFVDEALWAGDKAGENVLKGLITEPTLGIEGKGAKLITVMNRLHILMASNNDWVVPAGEHERRFFVLKVGEQHMQDHKYFAAIDHQMYASGGLEAMLFDLLRVDIRKFNLRKLPFTLGLGEQKVMSLDPSHLWWLDHLDGDFTASGWKSQSRDDLFSEHAKALGSNSHGKSSQTRLGMFFKGVLPKGYPKRTSGLDIYSGKITKYEFPPLKICRDFFLKKLGLTNYSWGNDPQEDTSEAP
jgi:hypothetical protein